jgi:Cu2+-containing amine oxidase
MACGKTGMMGESNRRGRNQMHDPCYRSVKFKHYSRQQKEIIEDVIQLKRQQILNWRQDNYEGELGNTWE